MARGKCVCVYGAKGGVGKTTFTLSMAGIFARMKKSVLIIDLDLSNGGIACALNREVKKSIFNFCDDYSNNRYDDMEKYLTKYNDNISFLACPKDPRESNKIEPKYIDIIIDKCLYKFDIILIDTTDALDEISVFAFDKADYIYFISTNDPLALKNLKNLINIFKESNVNNYKVVLNNSVFPDKEYFSLYDIKSILSCNVDYVISKDYHVKHMDSLTLDGDIITLRYDSFKDLKVFKSIAEDIVGGSNESNR